MGAGTKANTREPVRAPGGPLERSQSGVALQALGESSSSLGTEVVVRETASMGAEAVLRRGGSERAGACQRALTRKQTLWRVAAHFRLVIFVSLRMAANAEAPLSPMMLP